MVQNGTDFSVVNQGDNVVTVDQSGKALWVYDGSQTSLRCGFYPTGIDKDKFHNLLICDNCNHCIHYVDGEGQLLRMILTHHQTRLMNHWGISVTDACQVWVGNTRGNIIICEYTCMI